MRKSNFINHPGNLVDSIFRFFPPEFSQRHKENWRWGNKVANYFPRTFRKVPKSCWHKTNWETLFNTHLLKNKYYTGNNKAFFRAFAEGDLDALIKIINKKKSQVGFKLENLFKRDYLWNKENFLSPNRPSDSPKIRAEIWGLITNTIKDPALLPLWALATYQPPAIIDDLIKQSRNLNDIRAWNGISILYAACANGYLEIVRLLLDQTPDAIHIRTYGISLLHTACEKGHLEIAKFLLDRGAHVNATAILSEETPLHHACKFGDVEIAELLLDQGADVDSLNSSRMSPLFFAGKCEQREIAELLLDRGADASLLLFPACEFGYLEVINLLLDQGAEINVVGDDGTTPLHYACIYGRIEIVKLLLDQGANVNAVDNDGLSSLYFAIIRTPHIEIAKLLIDRGANIHYVDPSGASALHYASQDDGNVVIIEYLLDKGANLFSVFPWQECDLQSPAAPMLLLEKALNKIVFEYPASTEEYEIALKNNYGSFVAPLYKDKPDLLLLFAIFTNQPLDEIKRIIAAGANPLGSNPHEIIPSELAEEFCPAAVDYLKAQEDIIIEPNFDEESAGYDNPNEKKRSLNMKGL